MTSASLDAARSAQRRSVDPFSIAALIFFLFAIVAAAYPALRAGPTTGPGLLLLMGLAGVAFAGIYAFASSEPRRAQASDEGLHALVDALIEPAAVVSSDGRMVSFNAAWRTEAGVVRRLAREGRAGKELYAALAAARRTGSSEARIGAGAGRPAALARLGDDKLLVRLAREEARAEWLPVQRLGAAPPAPGAGSTPATLDAFAAAAPFGAALLDGDDAFEAAILEANDAMEALTGGAAEPGAPFGDLLDPASRAEARSRLALKRGGPVEVRLATPSPSGLRIAHLYVTQAEERVVAYLLDVSEQKQLELQLVQSQKMQAIGQLAGGVAHDFNNLLTAIQLRLDELLHRHPVGDPSYEGLNEIRQTGVRAADLVRKLLAFSRKQTVQRETLELGELISEFEVLLRRLLREDVRLETDYGRDLPLVRADKSQLETAVVNLAVNARDALRSHGTAAGEPATVRIRTARLNQM